MRKTPFSSRKHDNEESRADFDGGVLVDATWRMRGGTEHTVQQRKHGKCDLPGPPLMERAGTVLFQGNLRKLERSGVGCGFRKFIQGPGKGTHGLAEHTGSKGTF